MLSWIVVVLSTLLAGLWCIDSLLRGKKSKNGCRLPPGPKGLPLVGHLHMLSDLAHRDLHKLAQKYGPIMHIRLGVVPTIVVSSPEAAQLFLKTRDLVFASKPKLHAAQNLHYWEKNIIFAQYGSHWRNMRKVCTLNLLSATKIESMKSMRKEYVDNLVSKLRDAAQERTVVDLSEKVASLTEDMTYSMIFGNRYELLDFRTSAHEFIRLVGVFNVADYIPFVGPLDLQGIRSSMKATSEVVDKLLENIINEHEQQASARNEQAGENPPYHKDFIDVMLSLTESDSQYQLDRASMKAIILDMIVSAIDTSSVTIDWTLSELFRHPDIMKRVQAELKNIIGMDRMVEESDLGKLEYLDLVVKESMRLHPVAPLLVPREAREDITLDGYHIPKQAKILINTWSIGRYQNAWSSNFEEFYPERFNGADMDYNGNNFQFLPFGAGRRGCPGLQLGLTVVKLMLAQLLHCFNWKLPKGILPDEVCMKEKPGIAVPRADPLLAIPTFRLDI